jgi:phosphatidylglycerophosphatase A
MKKQKNTILDTIYLTFLSFSGTGYSPFAPGTVGSLATIPLLYCFYLLNLPLWAFLATILILTIISCFIAEHIQQKKQVHDPGWIVIDEVLGMMVTWSFCYMSFDIYTITSVFIIFRIFDIFKIWPATYFDKKVTHGSGTILDDIISGIFAGIVILIGKYFLDI